MSAKTTEGIKKNLKNSWKYLNSLRHYLALAGARGSRTHHTSRRTAANGFEVVSSMPDSVENLVTSFLADREYRNLSTETIRFYKGYIRRFLNQIDFPPLSASRAQLTHYISNIELKVNA